MELTSENIQAVLRDCLFRDEEITDPNNPPPHVKCEGVMVRVGLHPERLESHREDVRSMLSQLPDEFMAGKGDGMSMLQMPFTKDGVQYGEQRNADELFALGVGLGLTEFCLPRFMWAGLPGGMPYVVVKL